MSSSVLLLLLSFLSFCPRIKSFYKNGGIVIAALTGFGGVFVIAATIKHSLLKMITKYFVASLAAADFLVGILGIPCPFISVVCLNQNYVSCIIIILMHITVVDFTAINYPYKYTASCIKALYIISMFVILMVESLFCIISLHVMKVISLYGELCLLATVLLNHANSTANQILYAPLNSKIKTTLKEMIHPQMYLQIVLLVEKKSLGRLA